MSRWVRRIAAAVGKLRKWANDYEPATARAVVAAVVQACAVAGIGLGDLPARADGVLALVGIAATLIAGKSIRSRVTKPATVEWLHTYVRGLEAGSTEEQRDLAVQRANGES